jgi:UDP-glucuronate 4-epimerase
VRRFILASSSSIYGIANQAPFREDDTTNLPISPYAATKLAAEKICYTYSHLYGLACCCLRFFTVYGPRQRPDLAISKFIRLIDEGKPVPVFGDGSSGRDYTYCEDVVAGIVAALSYDCRYEVFNLGNSHPIRLTELIAAIEGAVGKRASIVHLPEQPGDVPITYADISKAERLLGYQPATPFAAGLAKQVAWYREQTMKTTPARV